MKTRTIKRPKGMAKKWRWRAIDWFGCVWLFTHKPNTCFFGWNHRAGTGCIILKSLVKEPADWTKTLRRIAP